MVRRMKPETKGRGVFYLRAHENSRRNRERVGWVELTDNMGGGGGAVKVPHRVNWVNGKHLQNREASW